MRAARSTISRAARRVKVTSMIRSAGVPLSTRCASVATIVRVLPEPAEASTSERPGRPPPRPAARRRASTAGARRPAPRRPAAAGDNAAGRRVGGEGVPGRPGVADGLLPLDMGQRRGRRLPARIAVGGGHGRGTLTGAPDVRRGLVSSGPPGVA